MRQSGREAADRIVIRKGELLTGRKMNVSLDCSHNTSADFVQVVGFHIQSNSSSAALAWRCCRHPGGKSAESEVHRGRISLNGSIRFY